MPIGARIFITETSDNLQIAIETRSHENLLEDLRALRQGVPLAGVGARGDDKVAGALGCGLDQARRLDLNEAVVGEELPRDARHLKTPAKDMLHARAA